MRIGHLSEDSCVAGQDQRFAFSRLWEVDEIGNLANSFYMCFLNFIDQFDFADQRVSKSSDDISKSLNLRSALLSRPCIAYGKLQRDPSIAVSDDQEIVSQHVRSLIAGVRNSLNKGRSAIGDGIEEQSFRVRTTSSFCHKRNARDLFGASRVTPQTATPNPTSGLAGQSSWEVSRL
jgi:hypothetical protein